MRFWQAVVIGQLAAGSVRADAHYPGFWPHISFECASIILGWVMWLAFSKIWGDPTAPTTKQEPNDG